MKFNTKYKYDKVSGLHFNKPSLTDQSQAYDCDINNIVNGMALTPQTAKPPQFGLEFNPDFYQTALNAVATAKTEFEKLPANIRREFDNDPMKLVQFMDNPSEENAKKGVKLGIFKSDILDKFKPVQEALIPISKPDTAVNPISKPDKAVEITEPVSQ